MFFVRGPEQAVQRDISLPRPFHRDAAVARLVLALGQSR